MDQVKEIDLDQKAEELEPKTAEEVLRWALDAYGGKISFASSFGAEDVVIIDILAKINPKARIFTLDTGRLPYETYDLMENIRQKYGVKIEAFYPDTKAVENMVNENGFNLFYESIEKRKLCCNTRKVEPLKRALGDLEVWITGLRREQAVTRGEVKKIEEDAGFNLIKVNPLADWNESRVWSYVKQNQVPYNRLHDKNYPSIGCAPCTRAIKEGEDVRAGRWWWEAPESKECGLHAKEK